MPKRAVEETQASVKELLRKLGSHADARLFKLPLDKANPRYDEFNTKYRSLTIIEMRFRRDEYANTTALYNDLDEMLFI